MASSNEEEQKEAKQVQQNPKIKPDKKLPEQPKTAVPDINYVTGLTFVIAIAALLVALYNIHFTHELDTKLINENKDLAADLTSLKQSQTITQEQIDAKEGALQHTQNDLQKKISDLNKQLHTAMNQRLYQNQDWLLLKARYYLELAQINAHWSDSFNATIALLQEADNLLKQLTTPQVFEVRQAIAKEITQLKATPTVDIAGLLSQLDAAQISVSNLTIQSTIDESKPAAESGAPHTPNPSAWRARLQDSVNLLEKLVVVRRNDEEIKPLMSPLFESVLKESIRLNLQEAQWAILNNNPIVYQLALKQAAINIKRTFNEETEQTVALLKQLNNLQQIKLTQEKPAIGLALPLLNQMINNKESSADQVDTSDKGAN